MILVQIEEAGAAAEQKIEEERDKCKCTQGPE